MNYNFSFTNLEKLSAGIIPLVGKSDCLAGELARAASRIVYRYLNDGDMVNVGYGKETCNPAARFLLAHGNDCVQSLTKDLWNAITEEAYQLILVPFAAAVADYIAANPELRDIPADDMWDYKNPAEDVDNSWNDED